MPSASRSREAAGFGSVTQCPELRPCGTRGVTPADLESYVESCVQVARIFVARRSPPSESRRGTAEPHLGAAEGRDRNVSKTSSFFSGTARAVRCCMTGGLAPCRYKSSRELVSDTFLTATKRGQPRPYGRGSPEDARLKSRILRQGLRSLPNRRDRKVFLNRYSRCDR